MLGVRPTFVLFLVDLGTIFGDAGALFNISGIPSLSLHFIFLGICSTFSVSAHFCDLQLIYYGSLLFPFCLPASSHLLTFVIIFA